MNVKPILGVVPGFMALGLVAKTMPNIKNFGMKQKGKKVQKRSIIPRGFVDVMVGIPMISATSQQINALP